MSQPTFDQLLRDPKARDQLTLPQLQQFYEKLKEAASGIGRTRGLPDNPGDFAAKLSSGEWRHAKHLDFLASKLRALERREIRRLMVSMPPRHGKSLLINVWLPIWWLTRHPRDQVVLAGYGELFARKWGGDVRDLIIQHREELNLVVNSDSTAADDWRLNMGGGMISVGVGGALTGRGANLLIIDDPIKNEQEANSEIFRQRMWDWWQATSSTRLEPHGCVVVVACLAGDTSVLLADGTERPIRDIRCGDVVATYEAGRITTAVVRNWANQGPDPVFAIKTKSGRVVRANARHPFLVERNGKTEWLRTDTLVKGDGILAIGANGEDVVALRMGAKNLRCVGDSARRTTTRTAGRVGFAHRLNSIRDGAGQHIFDIATALGLRSTNDFWLGRRVFAVYAGNHLPPRTLRRTENQSSSTLITAMRAKVSGGFSATTATSRLATGKLQRSWNEPQSTYDVAPDPVESVTPAGTEDVFDIQVDRTENFIANGLVSHNTRWHEDDLLGRLTKENEESKMWTILNIPALAEEGDVLGRAVGEPLWPERFNDDPDYEIRRSTSGPYWWNALFQGRPSPPGGGVLMREDWQFYKKHDARTVDPDQMVQSWDLAMKDKRTSDYTVGQVWARKGADFFLVDQVRGHFDLAAIERHMKMFTVKYPKAIAKLVEDAALGPALKQRLQHEVSAIIPIKVSGGVTSPSKMARAQNVVPYLQGHNMYLLENEDGTKPKWVWEFVEECAAFDKGAHDDQVDAMGHAIAYMQPGGWRDIKRALKEAMDKDPNNVMTPQKIQQSWFSEKVRKMRTRADKVFNPPKKGMRMW